MLHITVLDIKNSKNAQERIVKRFHQPQKILSDEEISKIVIGYNSGLTVYRLAK